MSFISNNTFNPGEYKLSKNQVITLSVGEYYDYYFEGPFICNSDFDLSEIASKVENDSGADNGPGGVIFYLINSGLVSKIDSREIHLGSNKQIKLSE